VTARHVGRLNPSSASDAEDVRALLSLARWLAGDGVAHAMELQVAKGAKYELPMWLSESLHAQGFVSLYPPRAFSAAAKEAIEVPYTHRHRSRALVESDVDDHDRLLSPHRLTQPTPRCTSTHITTMSATRLLSCASSLAVTRQIPSRACCTDE